MVLRALHPGEISKARSRDSGRKGGRTEPQSTPIERWERQEDLRRTLRGSGQETDEESSTYYPGSKRLKYSKKEGLIICVKYCC